MSSIARILPVSLLLLPMLQGCDRGSTQVASEAVSRVSVAQATFRSLDVSILASGSLVPREVVRVHAETPGLIVSHLLVEEGQAVRAGQPLARLVSERLEAELAGALAELSRAEQVLSRSETLRGSGVVAQAELERAVAAHAQAQAKVRMLEVDRERTELRSPVAGVLLRRHAELGDRVTEQVLFEVAAEGAMDMMADVSESRWHHVHIGQPADVGLADGTVLKGEVRRLSGAFDERTRLGRVWIALEEPVAMSGSGASARLHVRRDDTLTVPQGSVLHDEFGTYTYVVVDGKTRRRNLELGARAGIFAEVRQGLAQGDVVVARAGSLLRDGDSVRVATGGDHAQGGGQ